MIPFDMVEPASLAEAIALLDPQEPTIRAVSGGTALMLMMKSGVFQPTKLVCLHRIERDYAQIALTDKGELRIGAMATLSEVEHDAAVAARLPVLARANYPIRACAMSLASGVRWRTAIRTWTCRRCSRPFVPA